jgi:hypothetical protein
MGSKIIYLALLLIGLQSCGLFQNVEKVKRTVESAQQKELTQVATETSAILKWEDGLNFKVDSLDQVYTIHIKPTGPFKFSQANGYEGTAADIWMNVQEKGIYKSLETSKTGSTAVNFKKDSILMRKVDQSKEIDSQVKRSLSWKWIWIVLVAAAASCLFIYLKLKLSR